MRFTLQILLFSIALIAGGAFQAVAYTLMDVPDSGNFDQPGRGGMGGYEAINVGLIGGAERGMPGGLTVGGHVVLNHQSMTGPVRPCFTFFQ